MKKIILIAAVLALCLTLIVPAFAAYNYDFGSGPDSGSTFGTPTSNDDPVSPDPMAQNTRRNKDAAYLPPGYGVFSGEIPTDPSSLYHDNLLGGLLVIGGSTANASLSDGFQASTSTVALNTEPLYYDNGSIGTIYVTRTNKTITVYEGEELDNLKKGAGHFSGTSAWDGNAALCGHNRGGSAYFSFVKDMRIGDKVSYTTRYGTRVYEVISKEQIGEYDYSKLAWSAENLLTLITCVENTPEARWAVVLREIRD